ncbi:uncharacterized protein OCT59_024708 [Rhizophagus irregularis]|nr:hypothetical protein OCT59_024708 [Rhizophagus irregularis]GET57787.1 hypothetical protein GLOIN_2v1769169 [Rhizophagus irregularis DAOM 181602=DAOM 197198]CAB4488992.1 unnamed protein product [Rhizophagus irregularis]
MVVRRNDVFRTKHSSNNSIPCEQMKKLKKVFEADGQNAEIGNYIEEQTGLEAGKELTDSSESSSAEEDSQSKVWEEKIW